MSVLIVAEHRRGKVRPITLEMAEEALAALPETTVSVSLDEVLQRVSIEFGVAVSDLVSQGLVRQLTQARQLAMYLCRKVVGASFQAIGEKFGGRDHSTVMHAVRKITQLRGVDQKIAHDVDELMRRLQG